ncbi:uncharacterized protein MCAP_0864-like isoform X2 [Adelges cooleyi]|nr:uncharacterized protein MCAP_0864-like isoform X2 [Adelges cooleyi]
MVEPNTSQNALESVKMLDLHRMLNGQNNTVVAFKINEYEKAIQEKDEKIKSLKKQMVNSKNNSVTLKQFYKSVEEKTTFTIDTCKQMDTSFTSICNRLNKLGENLDNSKSRQKEIVDLVVQTTNNFQEKLLKVSEDLEDSLKCVNVEKMKAKNELSNLEIQHTEDLIKYKSSLENIANELDKIKTERNDMYDQLIEVKNVFKEKTTSYEKKIQGFENELQQKQADNTLLVRKNNSIEEKCKDLTNEIQRVNDELDGLKQSLSEKENELKNLLAITKDQSEQLKDKMVTQELCEELKKNNSAMVERTENLECVNSKLLEEINTLKSKNDELFNDDKKVDEICKSYDELLKIQEEKLNNCIKDLEKCNANEQALQKESMYLKAKIDMSNKTIDAMQEELKNNNMQIIPELQKKIDVLSTDLSKSHQMLRDSAKGFVTEKSELEKEKMELENENKDRCKQIEKLSSGYMKYKTRAKQLYEEMVKLRRMLSKSVDSKTTKSQNPETIEISDGEDNDDDVSIVEVNEHDLSMMDFSFQSSFKRNTPSILDQSMSSSKKLKMSMDLNSTMDRNKNYLIKEEYKEETSSNTSQSKNRSFEVNKENAKLNDAMPVKNSSMSRRKQFKIPSDIIPMQKKKELQNKQTKKKKTSNTATTGSKNNDTNYKP